MKKTNPLSYRTKMRRVNEELQAHYNSLPSLETSVLSIDSLNNSNVIVTENLYNNNSNVLVSDNDISTNNILEFNTREHSFISNNNYNNLINTEPFLNINTFDDNIVKDFRTELAE